jgi:hypothetical protein
MSERFKILYYTLWVLHPMLQVSIGAFMIRRGLLRQFKFYFGYLITQLITFAVVFPAYIHNSGGPFTFYSYWVCNAMSVTFGFLVIHEVFVDVFRMFHTLRDLGTVLFKWAGLVMLLVAGVVAVSTNSSEVPPWMQAIITSQRCVRMIQVGMVMFLLFFANYVGVSRKQHSFGIALGFGSFACLELLLISSWIGSHLTGPWISMVNMTAYNCSLGLWLGYVAMKQPAADYSRSLLKPQRWEQSLSDIHHTVPADSLIPMFEGMVDRALSRQPMPQVAEKANAAAAGNGAEGGTGNFAAAMRAASKT